MRKLYVGTYTRPAPYLAETNGKGLYVYDYDEDSGALSLVQEMPGIENPSYLCISPDGRNLHATWEVLDWPEGLVSSYAIEPESGQLEYLGVQGTRGTVACYVSMDSQARAAFIANYWSGGVAMFPTQADGSLADHSSFHQHEGRGPHEARQEGPHAHCIVVSADDAYAFSANLGADVIYGYRIDYEHMQLVTDSMLKLDPGSGPRHLVLAPDARHAYVICELDSTVVALDCDAARGRLGKIDVYPMLPGDFDGESHCADIQIHPSGRFVYGSNRGHDSIAMFRVDTSSGELGSMGYRSTEGATPRSFAISPDGRYMLVANQDSDTIVTMPIDLDSGAIGETVAVTSTPTPVCVKFGPEVRS